eukprot:scaffold16245_cov67-Phaeocystis_antarctica.AAC.5
MHIKGAVPARAILHKACLPDGGHCQCPFALLHHLPHALQLGAECAAASECDGAPGESVGADEARQQLGTARLGELLLCAARGRLRARHAQVDLGQLRARPHRAPEGNRTGTTRRRPVQTLAPSASLTPCGTGSAAGTRNASPLVGGPIVRQAAAPRELRAPARRAEAELSGIQRHIVSRQAAVWPRSTFARCPPAVGQSYAA